MTGGDLAGEGVWRHEKIVASRATTRQRERSTTAEKSFALRKYATCLPEGDVPARPEKCSGTCSSSPLAGKRLPRRRGPIGPFKWQTEKPHE